MRLLGCVGPGLRPAAATQAVRCLGSGDRLKPHKERDMKCRRAARRIFPTQLISGTLAQPNSLLFRAFFQQCREIEAYKRGGRVDLGGTRCRPKHGGSPSFRQLATMHPVRHAVRVVMFELMRLDLTAIIRVVPREKQRIVTR